MLCSSQLSFPLFHILNRRKYFSTILGRQQKGNNSVVVTMVFFCLQEENDGFFLPCLSFVLAPIVRLILALTPWIFPCNPTITCPASLLLCSDFCSQLFFVSFKFATANFQLLYNGSRDTKYPSASPLYPPALPPNTHPPFRVFFTKSFPWLKQTDPVFSFRIGGRSWLRSGPSDIDRRSLLQCYLSTNTEWWTDGDEADVSFISLWLCEDAFFLLNQINPVCCWDWKNTQAQNILIRYC